jgi:periplasmic protein CpxP/Spy
MKHLIVLFTIFLFLNKVNAQNKNGSLNPEEKANKITEKLAEVLKLTDKQKADINAINLSSFKEAETIEAQLNSLKEKRKKIAENTNSKIKTILSEEQIKKYDEILSNRREDKKTLQPSSLTNKKK